MKQAWKYIKDSLLTFSQIVGSIQAAILLSVVYLFVLGPIALIYNFLHKEHSSNKTNWLPTSINYNSLKSLLKQY